MSEYSLTRPLSSKFRPPLLPIWTSKPTSPIVRLPEMKNNSDCGWATWTSLLLTSLRPWTLLFFLPQSSSLRFSSLNCKLTTIQCALPLWRQSLRIYSRLFKSLIQGTLATPSIWAVRSSMGVAWIILLTWAVQNNKTSTIMARYRVTKTASKSCGKKPMTPERSKSILET